MTRDIFNCFRIQIRQPRSITCLRNQFFDAFNQLVAIAISADTNLLQIFVTHLRQYI